MKAFAQTTVRKKELKPHVYEVQTQLLAMFRHRLSSISSFTELYFQFMINRFSIRPYLLHFLIVNFKLMVNVFIISPSVPVF